MDIQRFFIKGSVFGTDDPKLQGVLAQVHETPERLAACAYRVA